MSDPDEKIHVMPLGDDWEVEAESGAPLAHEDKKESAVAVAVELAREEGIETIIVHDGDGVTEAVHASSSDNTTKTPSDNA
jgi:hypothetical protein